MSDEKSYVIKPYQHPPQPSWDNQHRFPRPSGWIQWKGTSVCADIHCDCGASYHIDAEFAYYVRCPNCRHIFALNGHIELLKLTPEEIDNFGSSALIEPEDDDLWALANGGDGEGL